MMTPEQLNVVFASLSALATMFAAYATWRSPVSAAKYAETLRSQTEKANQKLSAKRIIFYTLMQERAAIYSSESVKMLNSIDIVFHDVQEVRDAWAELLLSYDKNAGANEQQKSELLRKLLRLMAKDIGLSDSLRTDDFGRVYHPDAIAEEEYIKLLQRKAALKALQGEPTPPTSTNDTSGLWPPKPE